MRLPVLAGSAAFAVFADVDVPVISGRSPAEIVPSSAVPRAAPMSASLTYPSTVRSTLSGLRSARKEVHVGRFTSEVGGIER